MTIIYPMNLPSVLKFSECQLSPDYGYSTSPTRGGKFQVVSLMPTLWKAQLKTSVLEHGLYDDYLAWLDALHVGIGTFKLYDPVRQRPKAYLSGFPAMVRAGTSTPFDGTCLIHTVNAADNFEITLKSLPVGFSMTHKDYFAFTHSSGTRRALHRVVYGGGGVANSSGFLTLTVEPSIALGWSTSDVVELYQPWVNMIIRPDTLDRGNRSVTLHSQVIKFDAYQSLEL